MKTIQHKFIKAVILGLAFFQVTLPVYAQSETKRVLMIINEGFYAPEYYEPRKLFDQAGYQVTIAGKQLGKLSPDRRNTGYAAVEVNLTFEQVDVSQYDAVTFAGGNGAWTDYFPNESVHKILTEALRRNMITALICSSTGLLGVLNNFDGDSEPLAKGRHVTGYYRVEGLLKKLGQVNFDPGQKDQPYVVIDGNLITGRDPISSKLFGETVVSALNKL